MLAKRRGIAIGIAICLGAGLSGTARIGQAEEKQDEDSASPLEKWDQRIDWIRRSIWNLYDATEAMGEDARRRSLRQDVNEWLMGSATLERLSAARATAGRLYAEGDHAGATAALARTDDWFREELGRLSVVSFYWSEKVSLDAQRDLWKHWADMAPLPEKNASANRLDKLESQYATGFGPQLALKALMESTEQMKAAYDAERGELAALVSRNAAPSGGVRTARERRVPCPSSAPDPLAIGNQSGEKTRTIRRVIGPDSPAPHYPVHSKRIGVSGLVILRATVSETGCLLRSEVRTSSGVPELDDLAMESVEYMRWLPKLVDGQPVTGQIDVPMRFKISVEYTQSGEPAKP